VLKRSEATLVRDRRHELRVSELERRIADLQDQLAALQSAATNALPATNVVTPQSPDRR
jgi:hypothetical protein